MNFKNILFVAITITITIIAGLTSCKKDKKDDAPSPEPKPLEHPYLKIGNYWVFETVYVDDTGSVTHQGYDSTFVESDTLIGGIKWYKSISRGEDFLGPKDYSVLWRDSSGLLVNKNGTQAASVFQKPGIIHSSIEMNGMDTLYKRVSVLRPGDTTVTLQAGTFKVKNIVTTYQIFVDQKGKYVYKDTYNWYSEELGMSIYSTTFYLWPASHGMKDYSQKSLVRYKAK